MRLSTICGTVLAGTAFVAAAPAQSRQAGNPAQIPVDLIGMVNKYKTYVNTTLAKKDSVKGNKVCKHATVSTRKEW